MAGRWRAATRWGRRARSASCASSPRMARAQQGRRAELGAVTQGAIGGLGVAALFEAV